MGMPQQQLPLELAMERAQTGIEAAGAHADRVEAGWRYQALGALTTFANEVARPFLVEEARAHAEANGLPHPPDARAWGSVTQMASKGPAPRIRKVGAAPASSSNCSLKVQWIAASVPWPKETP